jgi:DinB family protein
VEEGTLFDTGEPHSQADLVAALRRLHEESEQYLAALPAAVFVAPQGEKWSPADHVRHLAKSTFPLARALGLPRPLLFLRFGVSRRGSRAFPELREVYLAGLAAGGKAGRYAPSPRPIPADTEAWRTQVLGTWRQAHEALLAQAARWPERSLDRYRLPHPLLGPLTIREMLFFTLYHNAHHLRLVAARVPAAAG